VLPPQSDHQSESLLHSLFLGCVSRGLLGFSHEDIIDFDIGAHGATSASCVSAHDIIHIGAEQATEGSIATTHEIEHKIAKAQREPARRGGTEMTDFTEIRKAEALFAAAVHPFQLVAGLDDS
jgi:hypothetical protein